MQSKSILLIAVLTLALGGCVTSAGAGGPALAEGADPGVSVTLGDYGAKLDSKHGSVTVGSTGANVETDEFKLSAILCFYPDGHVVSFLDRFGSLGGLASGFIACK